MVTGDDYYSWHFLCHIGQSGWGALRKGLVCPHLCAEYFFAPQTMFSVASNADRTSFDFFWCHLMLLEVRCDWCHVLIPADPHKDALQGV